MLKKSFKSIFFTAFFFALFCFKSQAQQGDVVVNQDADIDRLLALKKSVNRSKQNYTIRAFRGGRSDAESAFSAYKGAFSEWSPKLRQAYPFYEILVGNFNTRLEADRALRAMKSKCSMAFKNNKSLKNKCLESFIIKPKQK